MKKILLYIAVVVITFLLPTDAQDVAKLRPVQVVSIYRDAGNVVIETDTRDKGVGSSAKNALEDLEQTTPGVIYLDTAEYLIVNSDALDVLEALRIDLKDSVRLCVREGEIDLKEAAKYLSVHDAMPKMEHWKEGMELPVLCVKNDRLFLS